MLNRKPNYQYRGSLPIASGSEDLRWFFLKNRVEVFDVQVNRYLSVVAVNARAE